MDDVVHFATDDLLPGRVEVLGAQGVPPGVPATDRVSGLVDSALAAFRALAAPVGVVREIDAGRFADVFRGEGANAPDAMVGAVFPQARALAAFAATVGDEVGRRVGALFAADDFARASMLDAVASLAADATADRLAASFGASLDRRGLSGEADHVLPYSPGYCGWHVSGQRRLFDFLQPERVGISLNPRYLMTPLKSVSGVLVAGPTAAHEVPGDFDYCRDCRDRSCAARVRRLRALDAAAGGGPP